MDNPNLFEPSIDTNLLYARLKTAKIGELITYHDLSEVISADVTGRKRYTLNGARSRALRDDRIVFAVVRTEGLKRLDDSEIVSSGDSSIGRIRREARRGAKRVSAAEYGKLTNDEKIQHNTSLSAFGVLISVTKKPTMDRLRGAVEVAAEKLSLNKTLQAFRS